MGTLAAGLTWAGSIAVNPLMERVSDKRWITVPGVGLMSLGLGVGALSREVRLIVFFKVLLFILLGLGDFHDFRFHFSFGRLFLLVYEIGCNNF